MQEERTGGAHPTLTDQERVMRAGGGHPQVT